MKHHSTTFFYDKSRSDEFPKITINIDKPDAYEVTIKIGTIIIFMQKESDLIRFKNSVLEAFNKAERTLK